MHTMVTLSAHLVILEIVEVESYLEDVKKLQEELDDAENELNREKEKEKGMSVHYAVTFICSDYYRSTDCQVGARSSNS